MTTFTGASPEKEPGVGALTFGGFLEELATTFAKRPALLSAPVGAPRVVWTYNDLRQHSWAVAKALVAAGVMRATRIGVLMRNRPEWVSSVWGAAIAGGVAVPFNTFVTQRELHHLLRHSDVSMLLTETEFLRHRFVDDILALCPEVQVAEPGRILSGAYPFLRRVVSLGSDLVGAVQTWDAFLSAGDSVPDAVIAGVLSETVPAEDGIIIYSSGTTSLPKGILHRHRAAMLQCWRHAYREQYTPEDRVYSGLPLFWTGGFAAVLGATLASGACLVMPYQFDPEDALRLIEEERVTVMQCDPSHDGQLRACQARARRDISSLRRDAHRITGERLADGSLRPANQGSYGSSETFTSVTAMPNDAPPNERATYGRLIAGSSMRIRSRLSSRLALQFQDPPPDPVLRRGPATTHWQPEVQSSRGARASCGSARRRA